MNALAIIQIAIQYGSAIKAAIDIAGSNESILTKIEQDAPIVGPLLQEIGSVLWPSASPTLQKVGAAIAAFDPNITKFLQGEMNALLTPSPNLVVDGIYGPKTIAAVKLLQTKLGITADGIAGKITQAALNSFLSKSPTIG